MAAKTKAEGVPPLIAADFNRQEMAPEEREQWLAASIARALSDPATTSVVAMQAEDWMLELLAMRRNRKGSQFDEIRATLLVNFGADSARNSYGISIEDKESTAAMLLKVLEALTQVKPCLPAAVAAMRKLTPKQRLDVFGNFCCHCGFDKPACGCARRPAAGKEGPTAATTQAGRRHMRSFFRWYLTGSEEPVPERHHKAFDEAKANGWIKDDRDDHVFTLTRKGRRAFFDLMGHWPPKW